MHTETNESMNITKSINSLEIKKRIGYRIIYWTIFFHRSVTNVSRLLLYKINDFDMFDLADFCYIAKY